LLMLTVVDAALVEETTLPTGCPYLRHPPKEQTSEALYYRTNQTTWYPTP
jgi:hypothetical protein